MHRRPLSALIAAAITVSTIAGATAANAATPASDPASLTRASAAAHADASAALAGLALPSASASRVRAAALPSSGSLVIPLNSTIPVKVAAKRYDIHVVSTGAKTDRTSIRLFLAGRSVQLSVRRLVHVTVLRHGYRNPLLETTTTFKRLVVMLTALESNPLMGKTTHFTTRSDFVSAITGGLSISSAEVTQRYGALLRFVQMALDLASTLLQAAQYAIENPTATDFTGVPTVQTTAGSGGYAGSVTLTGTIASGAPQTFAVAVTNTTDTTALSETFDAEAITVSYTVDGTTYTQSVSLTA